MACYPDEEDHGCTVASSWPPERVRERGGDARVEPFLNHAVESWMPEDGTRQSICVYFVQDARLEV